MEPTKLDFFYLEPFSVCGKPINASFSKTTSASEIYGAILARGTMLDPEIQVELIEDFGVDADWQAIFEYLSSASQQAYLFQGTVGDTLRLAAAYERAYPDPWLASTIAYSEKHPPNTAPIAEARTPLRSQANSQRARKIAKHKKSMSKTSQKRNRK
jgi:hypothetical protein